MEYEIEDENRLFDPSTNPSLDHHRHAGVRKAARAVGADGSRTARLAQKPFLIPEADDRQMQ